MFHWFRSKSSKISDLEWPKAEFKKLKLVVFLKPNKEIVSGQRGEVEGQDQVHSLVLGRTPERLPEELTAVESVEPPESVSISRPNPLLESMYNWAQPTLHQFNQQETSVTQSATLSSKNNRQLNQSSKRSTKLEAPKTSVTGNI